MTRHAHGRTCAIARKRDTGTPRPWTILSRQVSWLTGHQPALSSQESRPSDIVEQKLIAYSCGGSFGIDTLVFTEFPLSSGCYPENHDQTTMGATYAAVNTHKEMLISLCLRYCNSWAEIGFRTLVAVAICCLSLSLSLALESGYMEPLRMTLAAADPLPDEIGCLRPPLTTSRCANVVVR